MLVRFREIDLGHGRYSLGRCGPATAVSIMSAMRQFLLAHRVSRNVALRALLFLFVGAAETLGPLSYLSVLDFGKENIGHFDGGSGR